MTATVVQATPNHLKSLCEKGTFRDLVRENGDFAVDLFGLLSMMHCEFLWPSVMVSCGALRRRYVRSCLTTPHP